METSERRLAYLAWAAVCFFWGTTYLAIRVGLETLPPALFSGLRFLIAGTILVLWLRLRGEGLPSGRDWLRLAVVGLSLLGVGNLAVVWSEQFIPSGMAALLVATSPFWTVGLEAALPGGERLTLRTVGGLLLGFAGLALLVAPKLGEGAGHGSPFWGIVALQVGCASWSIGSVYARRQPVEVKPLMGAAIQMLFAGVALVLVGTLKGEWPHVAFSGRSLAALLYLVAFGSILAYGSYIYALQKLPLSTISLYTYINPVIAVGLGWAFAGEMLSIRDWVAVGIILAAVGVVRSGPAPKPVQRGATAAAQQAAPSEG
ncbi:MAG TPA: EamA family transporter [Armatimonadota bacterium]|nr:EamA family transporter [Armatimonadota bacterium]